MPEASQPSVLDRCLRLFTDVRAGEGVTALLLSSNVFLLLTCYYVLKPVREALIIGQGSAEIKSYTSAAQVLVLALVVRWYGRLADRVPRRKLINIVTGIFAACLVGFYGLAQFDVPLGIVFFIWLGIFSLMLVAQFWAFANDIYEKDEGERLFPIVAFGASLGAVLGAGVAGVLIAPLGVYQLMLVGAVLLVAQVQITNFVDRRERRAREADLAPEESSAELTATGSIRVEDVKRMLAEREAKEESGQPSSDGTTPSLGDGARSADGPEQPVDGREPSVDGEAQSTDGREPSPDSEAPSVDGGSAASGSDDEQPSTSDAFALVFRTPFLLAIGVMMLLLNLVNTTGEYILSRVVEGNAEAAVAAGTAGGLSVEELIGAFYADFFTVVNIVGVVVQLFLVSRVIKYLGVRSGMMILPAIALGAYALIAFFPVLAYIRWAKTAENATDYSLNNTVRNMLFLPATREQKYKAKQTVDSFFVRVGDTASAALVFFGTQVIVLSTTGFAVINLVIVLCWLLLATWIGREYQRLVETDETPDERRQPALVPASSPGAAREAAGT